MSEVVFLIVRVQKKQGKSSKWERSGTFSVLRKQRLDYRKNVIFGHLNFSSLRNNFYSICELIKGKVAIFLINETKLDESFPNTQFDMSDYRFIINDRSKFGGGIAFCINDQLPNQAIKIENPSDTEILTFERL